MLRAVHPLRVVAVVVAVVSVAVLWLGSVIAVARRSV